MGRINKQVKREEPSREPTNDLANITQTHIYPGSLDPSIGGLSNSLDEWVELVVEGQSERAVDDPPIDVCAEIDLDNIRRTEHGGIASIRSLNG